MKIIHIDVIEDPYHSTMVKEKRRYRCRPMFCRLMMTAFLCSVLVTSAASATEYALNAASIEEFKNGIRYDGEDELIIEIEEDVTIAGGGNAGIESAAPVTIRSAAERTLTIVVDSDEEFLYGIKAPSITIKSGNIDITVHGKNDSGGSNAFGIYAGSGNVTISGGSVFTTVETAAHKNKGIYALRFINIAGGLVNTYQRGGSNAFGLDGGNVETENAEDGVIISGGHVVVSSGGAAARNYGIDSKFGTVRISGDAVVFIHEDESGRADNYAYNENITTISGGNAMMFTSEGKNYTLREDVVLTQNVTLLPAGTFEIPAGRTLGVSGGAYLAQPAGATLLFGEGYGAFEYAGSVSESGTTIYAGEEPVQQAPAPVAGLLAGLGAAVLLRRKG